MRSRDVEYADDDQIDLPSKPGGKVPPAVDPSEGARLMKAFLRVKEPAVRRELIRVVEAAAAIPHDLGHSPSW